MRTTVRRAAPALVLVFLAVLSVRWSIDRPTTILSLEWLFEVTLLGLALASIRPVSVVIDGFALFGVCAIALGCWLSYRAPSYRSFGDWLGLFGNKNGFGALIAFVLPFILVAGRGSGVRIIFGVASTLGVIGALSRIRSTTSNAAVGSELMILALLVAISHHRRRGGGVRGVTRWAGALLISVGSVAIFAPRIGLSNTPRGSFDSTFSNRTLIWKELIKVVQSHWIHGFGAGGFWSGSKGYLNRSQTLSGNASGMVTAHNGYLQEALSFGVLGLAATVLLSVTLLARGVRVAEKGRNGQGSLILLAVVAIVVQNSMEAMFTNPQGIHWLVIVLITGLAPSARSSERMKSNESGSDNELLTPSMGQSNAETET